MHDNKHDNKLPKILTSHNRKVSMHHAGKGFIIHQKYDSFHCSIPGNNLMQIQQVIDLKPNKLNIISKKRSLSEFIGNKKINFAHIQQFNKKIFILNQKPVQELQTFKSLINIKSPIKKFMIQSKLHGQNANSSGKTQPLWESNKSQTLPFINQMSHDFQVRPWNGDSSDKENTQYGFTCQ